MTVVVQLSDPHLGRMPEHEEQRIDAIAAAVRAQAPDLVVITGDLCDDAPCQPEQITQYGKTLVEALASLGCPVEVVPGNHDVGNKPDIENDALTEVRYDEWRGVFGDGWFRRNLGGWCLLGLNSQIMGSGWDAERRQLAWLDDQLESCERCVVFLHMPPDLPALVDVVGEKRENLRYWPVDAEPRAALLARLTRPAVKLVCSGHLHNNAAFPHATPPRRWCPSLSFGVVISGVTSVVSQGERIGFLRHELGEDDVHSTFVAVDLPTTRTMTL